MLFKSNCEIYKTISKKETKIRSHQGILEMTMWLFSLDPQD